MNRKAVIWLDDDPPSREVMQAFHEAGTAILNASDAMPDVDDMLLFDLQTPIHRFVAMPIRHRHTNDCNRA